MAVLVVPPPVPITMRLPVHPFQQIPGASGHPSGTGAVHAVEQDHASQRQLTERDVVAACTPRPPTARRRWAGATQKPISAHSCSASMRNSDTEPRTSWGLVGSTIAQLA